MKSKKLRTTKKRGPKPSGKALPMRQLRMPDDQYTAVANWAAKQADKPTWSEAVRRLIAIALKKAGV
jgi:hypothetical protein